MISLSCHGFLNFWVKKHCISSTKYMGLIRPLCAICFRGARGSWAVLRALPGPLSGFPRFPGHSFIRSRGTAGVAGVPWSRSRCPRKTGDVASLSQVQVYFKFKFIIAISTVYKIQLIGICFGVLTCITQQHNITTQHYKKESQNGT